MRSLGHSAAVLLLLAGSAAADPFYGLFRYDDPRPPVAGDCATIAAAVGAENTWYGQFSGKYYDNFSDNYHPIAARGCFESEFACRRWQNEAITYLSRGPVYHTSCRPGAPLFG
jgi:hypothetical protein